MAYHRRTNVLDEYVSVKISVKLKLNDFKTGEV